MFLLNPQQYAREHPDQKTRDIMLALIEFFEDKGKDSLKEDDRERVWYEEFLSFLSERRILAQMLTPTEHGRDASCRWDTYRNSEFSEILGFYGLCYWYTWQVSVLGLGPIWMSDNAQAKKRAAALLEDGAIFAFGLSERTHGADVYSTDMVLTDSGSDGPGAYVANGEKYYIGNANVARMVSTFGKFEDGEYCFFAADSQSEAYELRRNVVNSQSYVANYALHDYPVGEDDLLARGDAAWNMALNTVNIGKFNLGWASIGICTHAFYEAMNHAGHRRLYGMLVTDMPHVKRMLTDAYVRLVAMKLYGLRCSDYMRTASLTDRRYLLFDPTMKMKVTTQGEVTVDLLWDVIAAKGFEKDTYFEMAVRDIRALPKLEGTVHVNVMLIAKFAPNYLFNPTSELPEIGHVDAQRNDDFLFDQGPTRGLGKILFHDYNLAYDAFDLPNVNVFKQQIVAFKRMLVEAAPTQAQSADPDFTLAVGELFTSIVYGQLILENARTHGIDDDLIDRLFDCFIRDFARLALDLRNLATVSDAQLEHCLDMLRRPVADAERNDRVYAEVMAHRDRYEMPR